MMWKGKKKDKPEEKLEEVLMKERPTGGYCPMYRVASAAATTAALFLMKR